MNPRVSREQRARQQGDRIPDRQDRRQARHRLHPRRGRQRHHGEDPGRLRADARLRRRQGAAVRLREVPRRRRPARHADEVRRRGHGDRPQLHRGAAEGAAVASRQQPAGVRLHRADTDDRRDAARRRQRRPRRPASTSSHGRSPPGRPSSRCTPRPASTPGSSTRSCCSPSWRARSRRRDPRRPTLLRRAKRHGFSDRQLAAPARHRRELADPRSAGTRAGVRPVFKTVDTCAAEFEARTPYHYSSYDEETEVAPSAGRKVIVLGSGPNRIGQGIEFDYACVHAVFALRDAGYETVMVNCNPETVSTDYDTADRLYFEPLTVEDVLEVVHAERASAGSRRWRARRRHHRSSAARPRCASPPSSSAAGVPLLGHQPGGHRPRRGPRRVRPGARRGRPAGAEARHRHQRRRGADDRRTSSATRCWSGRPTSSAAAAWRSCTTTTRSPATSRRATEPARSTRCSSTASSTTRSRSTSTRSTTAPSSTSAASWSTSRRPASTPATPPARCRRSPSGRRDIEADPDEHRGDRRGGRRPRPAQRAVRAGRRRPLCAGGQPAGQPHRAVRLQGDRGAAGQGGGPGDARRDDRRAARRGAAAARRATAATCRCDAPVSVKEAVLPFARFVRHRTHAAAQRAASTPSSARR